MKIIPDIKGGSVYRRVPGSLRWYEKEDGKLLKQGKSWKVEYTVQNQRYKFF